MVVYVVTTEQWDDLGNIFHDFNGVFSKKEDAIAKKAQIDIVQDGIVIEFASIEEYLV